MRSRCVPTDSLANSRTDVARRLKEWFPLISHTNCMCAALGVDASYQANTTHMLNVDLDTCWVARHTRAANESTALVNCTDSEDPASLAKWRLT